MLTKTKKTIFLSIITLIVVYGIVYLISQSSAPGQLDNFTKCLGERGAKFYGTFWCSHCQNQKELFDRSAKYLPYVECSTPDGRGQRLICEQNNISGYPTWVFADGSRLSGEIPLNTLAEKTGCQLP